MVNTIGNRQTERALQMGTLFKPRQALAIDLVDELVTSESDLTKACEREAAQMAMIPGYPCAFNDILYNLSIDMNNI